MQLSVLLWDRIMQSYTIREVNEMAKHKDRRQRSRQSSAALLRNGLGALKNVDYDKAIEAWERLSKQSPEMLPTSALAQAYFRRGLKHTYGEPSDPQAGLSDLEQAARLQPEDACYNLHFGLANHHLGNFEKATRVYSVAHLGGGEFAERAAYPLALATLQCGGDPTSTPAWASLSSKEQAMLSQANEFRRRPYTLSPAAPPLWRGLASLDAGDHKQAQILLEDALQYSGNPTEEGMAHYYLGVLAAQGDDWNTARHHWNAARASGIAKPHLSNNMAEAYHRLAEERLESDDAEGSLVAAAEALRHTSDNKRLGELISQAHQQLAYRAASTGQWTAALEHWEAADHAEGGSFRLAYNLALAYERAEEFAAAGEKWREALRRRPRRDDHPDAIDDEQVSQIWRRAAEAYGKAADYDEAMHVYQQAVKWNPDHIGTRMALAQTLLANGRLQASENELNRILARDPSSIPALLLMGEVVAASGRWWQWNSPTAYWKRVLNLEPNNATAGQLLVDFYQDQAARDRSWGDYSDAIQSYQEALEYQPGNGRILAALGGCHLRMGKQVIAQDYMGQALATSPGDLGVYDEIIHAWLDVAQPDQAWQTMERAEDAIQTIPYGFYISQAYYCIQEGEDSAHLWLERAVETASPDEPVFVEIGEMAVTAEAWKIAREYLNRAIAAGQTVGQAHLVLGIVNVQEGDLEGARSQWNAADRVAHRDHDGELLERVMIARTLFDGPATLAKLVAKFGGSSLDPAFLDFIDDDTDSFFHDEDEDYEY